MLSYPQQDGPLHRALYGDEVSKWVPLDRQLLAVIADQIAHGNWQRGGDKNAPQPEPIPRPGTEGFARRVFEANDEDALTMDEMDEVLGIG